MFFKTFIKQSQTTESLPPPAPRDLLLRSRLVRLLLGSHWLLVKNLATGLKPLLKLNAVVYITINIFSLYNKELLLKHGYEYIKIESSF